MRAGKVVLDLVENEFVFRNHDSRPGTEGHRHDHPLIIHQGAVATAEIDDLILIAVVTTDEGVLARDELAATQANGVIARPPDCGGVADREFERFANQRRDSKFCGHKNDSSIWQQAVCDKTAGALLGWLLSRLVRESQSDNIGIMKTTLDIPEKELRDVVRFTRAKTKREAVVTAVMEFNRRKRMAALRKHAGVSDTFMSPGELLKLRQMD